MVEFRLDFILGVSATLLYDTPRGLLGLLLLFVLFDQFVLLGQEVKPDRIRLPRGIVMLAGCFAAAPTGAPFLIFRT